MSFGRPGALSDTFKVSPPLRGSFPLDHDGDCKAFMLSYMRCLKSNASDSGQCRPESRAYLECRMDNGLMSREDMQNLGLGDVQPRTQADAGQAGGKAAGGTAGAGAGGGPSGMRPEQMERI